MASNQGLQDDGAFVRFHADNNNNNSSEDGTDDPWVQTPKLIVKDLQAVTLNAEYSNQLTGVNAAAISIHIEKAEIDARVKNSADDYRACVTYAIGTCSEFTANDDRPDPVGDSYEERAKHYDAPSQIVFVDDLVGIGGGTTYDEDINCMIVEWCDGATYKTIGHEIGHGLNCDDYTGDDRERIMYQYVISLLSKIILPSSSFRRNTL